MINAVIAMTLGILSRGIDVYNIPPMMVNQQISVFINQI
jgi:hypothetical protein